MIVTGSSHNGHNLLNLLINRSRRWLNTCSLLKIRLFHSSLSPLHLWFILFHCTGCTTTRLDPPGLTKDYLRLAAANIRSFEFNVEGSDAAETIGHQYLLVLPLGSIVINSPRQILLASSYQLLSERGFSPRHIEDSSSYQGVVLSLDNISATAYDFFFFRMVNCKAEIAFRKTPSSDKIAFLGSSSTPRIAGFKPQLQACLEEALRDGVSKVLENAIL